MTRKEIQSYLINPDNISKEELENLRLLIEKYPYASTLRVLRLIGLERHNDVSYEQELKTTAIYSGDRNNLYQKVKRSAGQIHFEKDTVKEDPVKEAITKEIESIDESKEIDLKAEVIAEQYLIEAGDEIPSLDELVKPDRKIPLENEEIEEVGYDHEDITKQPVQPGELSDLADFVTHENLRSKQRNIRQESQVSKKDKLESFVKKTEHALKGNKPIFSPSKMAKLSLLEDETLVTETLAKVFAKQGNIKKAVKAYKQLSLKYPEKSIYFAAQIEKLDKSEGGEKKKRKKKKPEKLRPKLKKRKEKKKEKGKKVIKAKKKSKKKNSKKHKKK